MRAFAMAALCLLAIGVPAAADAHAHRPQHRDAGRLHGDFDARGDGLGALFGARALPAAPPPRPVRRLT
jgi:hypothetical protein